MVAESLNSKATASLVRVPGSGYDSSAEGVIVDFTKVCPLAYNVQSLRKLPSALYSTGSKPPRRTEKEVVKSQPPEETEISKNQASKESYSRGNTNSAAKGVHLSSSNCKRSCSSLSPEVVENQAKKRKVAAVDLHQTNGAPDFPKSLSDVGPTTRAAMPAMIQRQQNGQSYVISIPTASVPVTNMMPVAYTTTAAPMIFVSGIPVSHPSLGQISSSTVHPNTMATQQQLLLELDNLKKDNGILNQRLHRYQEVFKNKDLLDALVKKLQEETA